MKLHKIPVNLGSLGRTRVSIVICHSASWGVPLNDDNNVKSCAIRPS